MIGSEDSGSLTSKFAATIHHAFVHFSRINLFISLPEKCYNGRVEMKRSNIDELERKGSQVISRAPPKMGEMILYKFCF